ncbi:hypothetical protein JRQ81_006781 [Phrynocephalus forsythii]|uniref:Uncharacterized protein n=1 Tax=Phrynocephalus forsythii TaxID=171643 RepID=A0A9Q0XFL2_9SAUR|nr:hypothetical protein JRQ81_006781 [Phrynocephalus forsythii]
MIPNLKPEPALSFLTAQWPAMILPRKGERPTNAAENSRTPPQRTPCSPAERGQSVPKRPESPPPSSSPPMPVINNVFSLAPYRDYLEGTCDTVEMPLSKNGHEDPPEKAGERAGGCGSQQPDSVSPAEASQGPSSEEKDPSCHGMTDGSDWQPHSHSPGIREKGSPRPGQSVGPKAFPTKGAASRQPASEGDASNRAGEMERRESALALSCKMEGLAQVPSLQKPPGNETEAAERESLQSKGEEEKDVLLETKWRTSELPLKSSREGKSNFQSSAAFLFKKFKILKSHAASLGAATQPDVFPSFQPASSGAFSLHPGPGPVSSPQDIPVIPPSPPQLVMLQNAQRSPQEVLTRQSSSPAPESPHQEVTRQTDCPAPPRPQQESMRRNSATTAPTLPQAGADRSHSPAERSPGPTATQQTGPPVQPSPGQVMTQPSCPPIQQSLYLAAAPPKAWLIQLKCLTAKPKDTLKVIPPSTPASSPVLGEAKIVVPTNSEALGPQPSPGRYFTAAHTSVCNVISSSVSASSLEQRHEWLEKTESRAEPKEKGASVAKLKNGLKASSHLLPKLSKGQQIWLAFPEAASLFQKVLSQLDTFVLTQKCPFPHVVRAGAIFIPIHVVKGKLFPNLSGAAIDHVLQDHKVELRPTTLSEEKLLREVELRSCTSRMLKLLALKQLPDIYPDLLTLHWHECVKQQQLGDTSRESPDSETNISGAEVTKQKVRARCLQEGSLASLGPNVQERFKQGRNYGLAPRDTSTCLPSETGQQANGGSSQGCILEKSAAMRNANWLSGEKRTVSGALESKGLHPGAKRQLLPTGDLPRTLQVKLSSSVPRRTTSSTSKVLQLRKSVVCIKFQNALRDIKEPLGLNTAGKKWGKRASQSLKDFEHRRPRCVKPSALPFRYPELVGKRIRHLYEEEDKSEAWYQGVVLRVHQQHKNPLKTVYEVKYDSEPEWQYYLEILQDYKKGWLKLEE